MPAALALLCCLPACRDDPPAGPPGPPGPPGPRVLAVESFGAVAGGGRVLGTDGGEGWAGPWQERPFPFVGARDPVGARFRPDLARGRAESLEHADEDVRAAAAGGSAALASPGPGGGVTLLSRPLKEQLGLPGQTVYVGALLRADRPARPGAFGLMLRLNLPDAEGFTRLPPRRVERMLIRFDPAGVILGSVSHENVFTPSGLAPYRTGPGRESFWQMFGLGTVAHWRAERAGGVPQPRLHGHGTFGGRYHGTGALGRWISTGASVALDEPTLLVCGMEFFTAPNDSPAARYALWADPDPRAPGPPQAQGYIDHIGPEERWRPRGRTTWVTLMATVPATVDELRVADTFALAAGLTADD